MLTFAYRPRLTLDDRADQWQNDVADDPRQLAGIEVEDLAARMTAPVGAEGFRLPAAITPEGEISLIAAFTAVTW